LEESNLRRLGAGAGVAFIVLYIVSGVIQGSTPSYTASAAKITHYYVSNHGSILAGVLIAGLAAPLFVAWGATLAWRLWRGGAPLAGGIVLGCLAAGIGMATVAQVFSAGIDQAAVGPKDPGFVQGAYRMSGYFGHLAYWFAAVAVAATALVGSRMFARWYVWWNVAAVVLLALGGASMKAKGFFGVEGGMGFIALLALLVWVLTTSVLLWRMSPSEEPGRAATAVA
jgi:hypothetical protein